ncbi:hypothetical protein, partial [Thermincola ferriacetica]|uniref:hypothetical protein n=1 Tax=Thermincola ferriacetica TaxID=281456 RepID=UPI001A9A6CD5
LPLLRQRQDDKKNETGAPELLSATRALNCITVCDFFGEWEGTACIMTLFGIFCFICFISLHFLPQTDFWQGL